jgi:hypothetical protein
VQTKGLSTPAALRSKPWVIPLPLQLLPPQAWAWAKALLCEQQQQNHLRAKTRSNTDEQRSYTTANTVNPSTDNSYQPQQKQTAKEAIAANVQALIEQLEQGHSEGLTAYLTAMGRFHNYSFGNILEIARQKPDATRVAGLYAWNQLKRKVRKGEHGIRILAPVIGIKRKKDGMYCAPGFFADTRSAPCCCDYLRPIRVVCLWPLRVIYLPRMSCSNSCRVVLFINEARHVGVALQAR